MTIDIKKKLKKEKTRSYIARDLDGFRSDLLRYAKAYFPDKIQDFSEASVGGLLLDMAAMVGDSMSFYADYQFNELNWDTAVERKNIHRHVENAGIKIPGPSPAVVEVEVTVEVPSIEYKGEHMPDQNYLPNIRSATVFSAGGLPFTLTEDLDFLDKDYSGNLLSDMTISAVDPATNLPTYFRMSKTGICLSGTQEMSKFTCGVAVPFKKIMIPNKHATDIISVKDAAGNEYYEVESLAQDTVFVGIKNINEDVDLVPYALEVKPAPRRYTTNRDMATGMLALQFGSGNADTLDDDIIPDPSELSLPLYGKTVINRFSLDPNKLLKTDTLGLTPSNTSLSVSYRAGGGLSHNVGRSAINSVNQLYINFPLGSSITPQEKQKVRSSIKVTNPSPAAGGANAPTLEQLRALIPSARQMQSRVVSKQDLLSRIYTMPSKFGRVFRAGIKPDPNNHLSSQLFIISLDSAGRLAFSPDALKTNLSIYLNEFRLVSDALDVLDAKVINFGIDFNVVVDPDLNKEKVIHMAIARLRKILGRNTFQIDQPILTADIMNAIINTPGVISLLDLSINNIRGITDDRAYSDSSHNLSANTFKGLIVGPPGSIFELRYPIHDISGIAT